MADRPGLTITIEDASHRFGALLDPSTRTYRHFDAPEGTWRPEYRDGRVDEYRLHGKPRPELATRWRRS